MASFGFFSRHCAALSVSPVTGLAGDLEEDETRLWALPLFGLILGLRVRHLGDFARHCVALCGSCHGFCCGIWNNFRMKHACRSYFWLWLDLRGLGRHLGGRMALPAISPL